jgi:protein-disulfide isomerase
MPEALRPPTTAAPSPTSEKAEIKRIVRDYLLENPEIIRDALLSLQRRESEAQNKSRVAALKDNANGIFEDSWAPVVGNPDGVVQMAEFFDYNCGYCRAAHSDMMRLIAEKHNLRIVLKQLPLLGPASVAAARVGIAVNLIAPEKYLQFHERIYGLNGTINSERAKESAIGIGIDGAALEDAIRSPAVEAEIGRNTELAKKVGITGTPSYVFREFVLAGAVGVDRLRETITRLEAQSFAGQK